MAEKDLTSMTDKELADAIVAISKKLMEDQDAGDMKQVKKDIAESKRLNKEMNRRSAEIEKEAREKAKAEK